MPLIRTGLVAGTLDSRDYVEELDRPAAEALIRDAIGALGEPAAQAAQGEARPWQILVEVAEEARRQDADRGGQDHPDGTASADDIMLARYVRRRREAGEAGEADNWRDVLDNMVTEAFGEPDPAKLRAGLVRVAAVAVAWVEAIDRRT